MTMQTNPMKDSDEWLDTILDLYRRDIERHYGGRTVGKTLTGEEAKAAIQAHYQAQAVCPKCSGIPQAVNHDCACDCHKPYITERQQPNER